MKLHFTIPVSERLRQTFGSRYVLYSLYLEGFLFCKVRYSQLHHWNDQLRRVFGSTVPAFPPKFYLAMTASMADERRSQLEEYLQNVTVDPSITNSDVFISFFRKLQQVVLYKMGLSRELMGYFSLFFLQDHSNGVLSVVKKVAEFELPYVSLQSMKELGCKIGIRKWYMDPSLDTMLMGCRAAVNLLYIQALQEIEKNWVKPTDGQMQKLELLQKEANKTKVVFLVQFLELVQEVQHYGYMQLDPCACDYPEVGCSATVHVGNKEISCCIKLPSNQTKEVSFKISRVRCWEVTFLGASTQPEDQGREQTLELRFEYCDSDSWRWIVFYTKQAFLLSSCFKKIISEQLIKTTKEDKEMQVEMPESLKSKKSRIQQSQIAWFDFIPRKRVLFRPSEEDNVFEKIREEDL
ncbi:sorting nexin-31 isoform X4 [Carettochelys insculpta]|uniref:sorting nexin-31 isoform X4 n=1 Tax=Carettochelys insculpta TaxID=44489 RepID=UPI003EB8D145